ncbi:LysR family transcriptional regulator [Tabrizicola fusiformis]|uniref:LysR family transcriptional regulator n=1 Tax=Tabrizicola sp. SY72 TaxID=2741673 RepID=UPI00157399C3|nr:LysR family transcriptional regulator [Tabrizicola sp. SY72]NTT87734.1 LysR family transcriptional regulator [Tabrizicola sp. SY72]
MAVDWMGFPSLTALRAFEAAARLQGFSQAARALNVTHAAVAQQVRSLEERLGLELIYREGRGLKLTAKGVRLAQALADGFQTIEQALSELRSGDEGSPLRITMTPAFATQWLMPRLGEFWAKHPDVPLLLHPEQRTMDLRRDGLDLGIRFGSGKWPGVEAELLTTARYVIVGAPDLVQGRKDLTAAEMSAMPWVIEQDWPEALEWLKGNGLRPDALQITLMPNEELALAAAREGLGLHVEAATLVEQDVEEGYLVVLASIQDESLAYYMVRKPGPVRPELRIFMKWLKSAI